MLMTNGANEVVAALAAKYGHFGQAANFLPLEISKARISAYTELVVSGGGLTPNEPAVLGVGLPDGIDGYSKRSPLTAPGTSLSLCKCLSQILLLSVAA